MCVPVFPKDPITYYTSLHIAVMRNKPDMVELLVQEGADINRRDRVHESSPLDLASEEPERLPCLKRLLELGADVNAVDKHGKTALLHALASSDGVQIHNTENIRLLLEGGELPPPTRPTKPCCFLFQGSRSSAKLSVVSEQECEPGIKAGTLLPAHSILPKATCLGGLE
ncbi:ankyrin repeat and SOCS box protein 6-like [Podarcis raffonei]|uniref:ankyrin repeat and SOCS box protein 6-like n=1 Tax=Podarcis raffonei TaxID=65483 RepID=UPI0023298C27|nr:ankyrin repeat and SOCS box protein 6-like [Podarcis raffonei]